MITAKGSARAREKANRVAKQVHVSLLKEERPIFIKASGASMHPFIKDKDVLKIVPVRQEDIRIGDLVAVDKRYGSKGWFCVHRVVRIISTKSEILYQTKGDSNTRLCDEPVDFKRIAGRVSEIKRRGLVINMETPFWRNLNPRIAYFSLRFPAGLRRAAVGVDFIMRMRPKRT